MSDGCCAPGSGRDSHAGPGGDRGVPSGEGAALVSDDLVPLAGGAFVMGTDGTYGYRQDGEGPAHEVVLAPFSISRVAVTNAQFGMFIEATGYRTDAERYGWSFVFGGFLPADFPPTRGVVGAPWWRQVEGADWAHPEGPRSSVAERLDHPVTQVSWNDASAFCAWSATRLPTEAEWEFAARGGVTGCRFPWGDELEPGGRHRMNVFQGRFPSENTVADGYAATAPVRTFEPNGFGLFQMTGNAWEWVADWFDPECYGRSPRKDPSGPRAGTARVMRGGSYLCHASYCNRYRVDARSSNTPDSTTGNLSLRVARSSRPVEASATAHLLRS